MVLEPRCALAYAYWKETGDISVWKGIAQDAIVMNLDDLLCVGATNGILLSSTIGRNKRLIPGEVIAAMIEGTEEFLQRMRDLGIGIRQHRWRNRRCWRPCSHRDRGQYRSVPDEAAGGDRQCTDPDR